MTTILHLVGPGGAGKTTVGPLLAQQLGWRFLDLDAQYMAREGDIARCIQAHGYAGYAARNIATYVDLRRALTSPTVLALSSGFLTYPAGVDAQYPALRKAIERDPLTALLLPAFALEPCVAAIVQRQLARPYLGGDRAKEERVIRERFARCMALSCARFRSDATPTQTAMEIAQFARRQGLVPTKACPVVLRHAGTWQILAFEHPLAGCQLVKGTIEPGESASAAAVRELREESGLQANAVTTDLGLWASGHQDQVWSFQRCDVVDAPHDSWVHYTEDDGGHAFRFFWHPLDRPAGQSWHQVFRAALAAISQRHVAI